MLLERRDKMQHEVKKVTLIVNELLTLLLLNGAEDVDVKVNRLEDRTEITLFQPKSKYDDEFIHRLRHNLNTQRQYEVEGYYWQLVGETDSSDELHLVGAMVDEAIIENNDGDLSIHITRKYKY
jgi:hypothetical protein